MTIKDFVDQLRLRLGDPEGFIRSFWVHRINQIIKRALDESEIWRVIEAISVTTGDSSEALPSYMIRPKDFSFIRDSDSKVLTMERIGFHEQQIIDLESNTPTAFAVNENTIYFNAETDIDFTINAEFIRTLSSDLSESSNLNTVVTPFKESYNMYLEDLLFNSYNRDVNDFDRLFDEFVERIRYNSEKDPSFVHKPENSIYHSSENGGYDPWD